MNFENARVLDYSRQTKTFDSDFRFGADTSYSIEGYLLDLSNNIGVSGILEASEFFRTGLQDYQNITINGENFGKGRVSNFTVNESNFIQWTTYNLEIQGFDSGNLFNLTGIYSSGIHETTGVIEASYLLEEFSDEISFSRSDDSYSKQHSVSIKYASGDNILISPIDRAKDLAYKIFDQDEITFSLVKNQTSGVYDGSPLVTFSENIDAINGVYSANKNFTSLNPSGEYSLTLSHKYDLQSNGVANISEDAEIKVNISPKSTTLTSAINTEIGKSYNRCLDLSNAYLNFPISGSPLSLSQSINNFAGEGNYSVVYTNDPSFNNSYIWRYTHQINKNGTFYEVSEDGNIEGLGSSSKDKYSKALAGYNSIKTNVKTRVQEFYDSAVGGNTLYLISSSENKNQFQGTIGYSQEFSDQPSFGVSGLKKLETSIEDTPPVSLKNTFGILGDKELVQLLGTTTLGQRSLTMNLQGYRDATLDSILTIADSRVNGYIPIGNDVFVNDVKYSFDTTNKIVNLNVVWSYNQVSRESEIL